MGKLSQVQRAQAELEATERVLAGKSPNTFGNAVAGSSEAHRVREETAQRVRAELVREKTRQALTKAKKEQSKKK